MKNGYKKRLLSFVVVLSMLLSSVAGGKAASAATQIWGEGGTELSWTGAAEDIVITVEDDVMTVTGTGAMGDYNSASAVDYLTLRTTVTKIVVSSGITAVGKINFANFTKLTSVELADSVVKIGTNAFAGCTDASLVIDIKGKNVTVDSNGFGGTNNSVIGTIKVYDQTSLENVSAMATSAHVELVGGTDELKQNLQQQVKETKETYQEADYTSESYETLKKALENAEAVIEDSGATAEQFTEAKQAIEAAIKKLVLKIVAEKGELDAAITKAKGIDTGGYTTSSAKALKDAIEAAEKVSQKEEATLEEIQLAREALEEAAAVDDTGLAAKGLKKQADIDHNNLLSAAITGREKSELYTKDSYAGYQAILDKIEEMRKKSNDITNQQIEAVLAELEKAKNELVRDEGYTLDYKEYEKAKEAALDILNDKNSPYTKKSLDSLKVIYDNQKAYLEDETGYVGGRTQEQVDNAVNRLKDAIDPKSNSYCLVEKGDITELADLIASAKQLDESKYTAATWKTLSARLAEAEALAADPDNAGKADVEASVKALQEAMKGLEEKKEEQPGNTTSPSPDPGGDVTQPSPDPGGDIAQPSPDPGEDGTQPTTPPDDTDKVSVKKVTIQKVSSPKKKTLKITWKKVSGVTGYQIRIGTDKKTTKNKKVITVKGAKTVNTTIGKLKSKKTYYVKVRAYKTDGGKKYYGDWSQVKKIKVK